ncbi:MAG TPA: Smr/MutS family protein [Polyangia bacterium]
MTDSSAQRSDVEIEARMAAADLAFLDWPELLARLSELAQSARGRELCLSLSLLSSREEAEARMADVAEAARLLEANEALPALVFPEIEPHLDAVEKGVPLSAEELKQVAAQCEVSLGVRRRISQLQTRATGPTVERLAAIADDLDAPETLVFHARDTFDAAGELRDSASPELFRLRRERDQMAVRARSEAERVMKSEDYAPYLQDEYVTLREDRFVLPLRASFKSMGLGIVHDTSNSGETVFVEPTRIVELNNRLKVAEIEIRRESRRILEELAAMIAAAAPALRSDREILTHLDVIFASARLAIASGAAPVSIVEEPVLALTGLRHPLLALRAGGKAAGNVVANDVNLGDVPDKSSARVLVISGPNAGGKTVLLKAVGLAVLAARAGLLVPASPGGRVGFFDRVLADIGDQQSVLADLSTFSAHLANVARIIETAGRSAGENVLVLCDELMAGTHPEQGAALARATLEALADSQAVVITTTHYDSLKGLTDGDGRFRNAGMEYDIERLRPTFRLRDGLPGRSYALDIAARMGLPEPVLARARDLVGASSLGLEDILRDLETREAALASAQTALDDAREDLEAARLDLEARIEIEKAAAQSLNERERQLAASSREVIDRAVRDAREEIRAVLREVRQQKTLPAVIAAREKLEKAAADARAGLPAPPAPALDVAKLREALANRALGVSGDSKGPTKKTGSGKPGKGPDGHKAGASNSPSAAPANEDIPLTIQTRSNSVDVRGHRADEALRMVENYLDQAAMNGADTVFVIHGHGTGALRRAIREYLAVSAYVARFRPGGAGEGGDGVSVVSLRG